MLQNLTKKLRNAFACIGKGKTLTEENLAEAIRSVRLALLDADVNYSVASQFIKKIKEEAVGKALIKSVKPQEQFTKIVHDALQKLMGEKESPLLFEGKPSGIMLCGLQGSGKTTHSMKLAHFLQKKQQKKVLVAACDLQRPAAVLQLQKLGKDHNIAVYAEEANKNPVQVAKNAYDYAFREKYDVVIFDTAGRLHLDEGLMQELLAIKQAVLPKEILFVASAATGQDAVKTAEAFHNKVSITGVILTMLDGDARAGAALSILAVTKQPLKFEGTGEKIADLQVFHPKSMADRILGMGDIVNLVRKAEDAFSKEEGKAIEQNLRSATFTYADYLQQMRSMRKLGPLKNLMKMMPGAPSMGDIDLSDKRFTEMEAIILSMTLEEREEKVALSRSRKKRIAGGSGTSEKAVEELATRFKKIKQFCKKMPKNMNKMGSFRDIQKTMGKMKWR